MNDSYELAAGLAIVYAIAKILKAVFDFITKQVSIVKGNSKGEKNGDKQSLSDMEFAAFCATLRELGAIDWSELEQKIDSLYEWHAVVDEDGVKRWYVKRATEKQINDAAENTRRILELIERLTELYALDKEMFERLLTIIASEKNSRV